MSDEADVFLPCHICGRAEIPGAKPQPWAVAGGVGLGADWVDGGGRLPLPVVPAPGRVGRLAIGQPFAGRVGVPFWTLYMPPLAAGNGIGEYPEYLASLTLVRCRILRVLDRRPYFEGEEAKVAAEAEVLETLTLDDLLALPPVAGDLPPMIPFNEHTAAAGPYRYVQGDVESDAGTWAVGFHDGARDHLLLWGEWGCDHDTVLGGHLLLDGTEPSPFGSP